MTTVGGFRSHGGTPKTDAFFHGKSIHKWMIVGGAFILGNMEVITLILYICTYIYVYIYMKSQEGIPNDSIFHEFFLT